MLHRFDQLGSRKRQFRSIVENIGDTELARSVGATSENLTWICQEEGVVSSSTNADDIDSLVFEKEDSFRQSLKHGFRV